MKPDSPFPFYWLGWIYNDQGKYAEAETVLRNALRLKPDYSERYNELGYCLRKLGRYSEAVSAYKAAINLNPDLALAQLGLGDVYFYHQQYRSNLRVQRDRLKPDNATAFYNLAWCYNDSDQFAEAECRERGPSVSNRITRTRTPNGPL